MRAIAGIALALLIVGTGFMVSVPAQAQPAAIRAFTQVPAGTDAYVTKTGSDTTGTGTAAKPYATFGKALASGAQHIYLSAGTWPAITGWNKSGTATSPVVIATAPGEPSRAIIDGGFQIKGNARVNYLWLMDLDVRAGSAEYALDFLAAGGAGIRVEGCIVSGGGGVRVQSWPAGNRFTDMTFFRTCITNAPNGNGMYVADSDRLTVDECAFVDAGGKGDIRMQSFYGHQSCTGMTIKNSIVAYAGAGGFQVRPGTRIDQCFGYYCAIPFQIGHAETGLVGDGNVAAYKATGSISNSVAVGGADTGTGNPRGFAFWFDNGTFTCDNNLALNGQGGSQPVAFALFNGAKVTITNSAAVNWNTPGDPNVTANAGTTATLGAGNDFRYAAKGASIPASAYPAPGRTLAQYAGSDAAFFNGVKANWHGAWDPKFTAQAANDWFRAGVGRGPTSVPPVVVPPVDPPPVTPPPVDPPPVVPPVATYPNVTVTDQGYTVITVEGTLTDAMRARIKAAVEAALRQP